MAGYQSHTVVSLPSSRWTAEQHSPSPHNAMGACTSIVSATNKPPRFVFEVPWSHVFEFLNGLDAARVVMTCRKAGPWEPQDVEHAMRMRLQQTQMRTGVLERYGNTRGLLPKLVYCVEKGFLDANGTLCRTDGHYQSIESPNPSCWGYLRFYPDGVVISVSSTGTPTEVARWFNRRHNGVSRGTYQVEMIRRGPGLVRVSFDSTCQIGTVEYKGYLRTDGVLCFQSFSRINGHKGSPKYRFIPS